ncbi:MAG TPA: Crp/Fnr family transcriptional regulator [Tepidisphaeraceae bacterium]|nr:Crp/Fnr family transcriptional regulator [Tepidisphaeraceae bacterium]
MSQVADGFRSLSDLFSSPEVGAEGIEVSRGAVVYDQGTSAEHLYFIHHGQVRLFQVGPDGEERLVEILGPGQWFGCAALSDRGQHSSQAIAATQAQLSKVGATQLLSFVTQQPHAAAQLITQLAGAVQNARDEAARLVFQDCNQRLVSAMIRFSDSAAATQQGDNTVLHLTHEQLAQAVGAARETISLALTEMRHRNLVRTGRNRLIFNRDALKQFASPGNGSANARVHAAEQSVA